MWITTVMILLQYVAFLFFASYFMDRIDELERRIRKLEAIY